MTLVNIELKFVKNCVVYVELKLNIFITFNDADSRRRVEEIQHDLPMDIFILYINPLKVK